MSTMWRSRKRGHVPAAKNSESNVGNGTEATSYVSDAVSEPHDGVKKCPTGSCSSRVLLAIHGLLHECAGAVDGGNGEGGKKASLPIWFCSVRGKRADAEKPTTALPADSQPPLCFKMRSQLEVSCVFASTHAKVKYRNVVHRAHGRSKPVQWWGPCSDSLRTRPRSARLHGRTSTA